MPRKVFVAGEILTAADVNTNLMDQAVMVFADDAARGSAIPSPSEGMVTYLEDSDQVQVYNGSSFGPIGTILQVVSTTKTNTFSQGSVAGGGFSDTVTGLTASLTPSATSSKVLVQVTAHVSNSGASDDGIGGFRLMRDSTAIAISDAASSRARLTSFSGARGQEVNDIAINHVTTLDSPNTTSSITYGIQLFNAGGASQTLYLNRSSANSDSTNIGQTVSSITLMEVAG